MEPRLRRPQFQLHSMGIGGPHGRDTGYAYCDTTLARWVSRPALWVSRPDKWDLAGSSVNLRTRRRVASSLAGIAGETTEFSMAFGMLTMAGLTLLA